MWWHDLAERSLPFFCRVVMPCTATTVSTTSGCCQPLGQPRPPSPIPAIKTDLKVLDAKQDLAIWLGHSSYFVQLGGHVRAQYV